VRRSVPGRRQRRLQIGLQRSRERKLVLHDRASRAGEGRPVSPRALYSHVRLHYNIASDPSAFRWAPTWTCKGVTGRKAIIRRETILCTSGKMIDRTVGW
jgi:hypothetical protein